MRRLEASPARAASKGHETFISRPAPHREAATYITPLPSVLATHVVSRSSIWGLERTSAAWCDGRSRGGFVSLEAHGLGRLRVAVSMPLQRAEPRRRSEDRPGGWLNTGLGGENLAEPYPPGTLGLLLVRTARVDMVPDSCRQALCGPAVEPVQPVGCAHPQEGRQQVVHDAFDRRQPVRGEPYRVALLSLAGQPESAEEHWPCGRLG